MGSFWKTIRKTLADTRSSYRAARRWDREHPRGDDYPWPTAGIDAAPLHRDDFPKLRRPASEHDSADK